MKKIYKLNILLLIILLVASACEEEKVQPFSAERGINFVATDGPGSGKDTYTLLNRSVDMIPYYLKGAFDFKYDTLKVLIRLEGTPSDHPLRVSVKALPVEGYATPEFIIPETSIKAGSLIDTVRIYTKHLAYMDSTYKARIVFDYDNSDVVAGVKQRQEFILSASDRFPLSYFMFADNKEEWNQKYASFLGTYGHQKVRFIYFALKGSRTVFSYINIYDNTTYLVKAIPQIKADLEAYNKLHKDNPLKEEDGSLVTFE